MMPPLINGNTYSHTSLTITISDVPYTLSGVKEISYKWKSDPGKVFGTSIKKLARTAGNMECDGSITLFKEEADQVRRQLAAISNGIGYGYVGFNISVCMQEAALPFTEDQIVGARITGEEIQSSAGNEASTVKWDLDIMDLVIDGVSASTEYTAGNSAASSGFTSAGASVSATLSTGDNLQATIESGVAFA